jgi:hypothetical protein
MTAARPGNAARHAGTVGLILSVALHLLLLLAWQHRPRPVALDDDAPPTLSVRLLPRPAPLPAPAPRQAPRSTSAQRANSHPAAPPVPLPAPAASARTVTDAATAAAPPEAPSAPAGPSAADILAVGKREAGRIDRELRAGKPGVPEVADTPWGRFRQALAAAHKDRSHTMAMDSFEGPDGTTIYRFRRGDKVYCRSTGGVAAPSSGRSDGAILAGAGSLDNIGFSSMAGAVPCPTGNRGWTTR